MLKQKFIIFTIVAFMLVAPVLVSAETPEPELISAEPVLISDTEELVSISGVKAGITPGNYLYFFDKLLERIDFTLTFSSAKKAEKTLRQAEERLAELQELSDDDKFGDLEELLGEYESKIAEAYDRSESLKDTEKSEKLLVNIEERTVRHQEVLNKVLEQVPEEVRETIQRVIKESLERQVRLEEKVIELKKENAELRKRLQEEKAKNDDDDDEGNNGDSNDSNDSNNSNDSNDSNDSNGNNNSVNNSQGEGSKGINLYIDAEGNKVKLNWYAPGVDTSKGFKLIEGYGENPVYSDDNAIFVEAGNKSYEKTVEGGEIMNYKLCSYAGTECVNYSNNVKIWIPKTDSGSKKGNSPNN